MTNQPIGSTINFKIGNKTKSKSKGIKCSKCGRKFNMPSNFCGTIICESCDPFMTKSKSLSMANQFADIGKMVERFDKKFWDGMNYIVYEVKDENHPEYRRKAKVKEIKAFINNELKLARKEGYEKGWNEAVKQKNQTITILMEDVKKARGEWEGIILDESGKKSVDYKPAENISFKAIKLDDLFDILTMIENLQRAKLKTLKRSEKANMEYLWKWFESKLKLAKEEWIKERKK